MLKLVWRLKLLAWWWFSPVGGIWNHQCIFLHHMQPPYLLFTVSYSLLMNLMAFLVNYFYWRFFPVVLGTYWCHISKFRHFIINTCYFCIYFLYFKVCFCLFYGCYVLSLFLFLSKNNFNTPKYAKDSQVLSSEFC